MKHIKKFENNTLDIKCVKIISDGFVTYIIYVDDKLHTFNYAYIDSIGMVDEWFYGFNDGLKVFNVDNIKIVDFESDIFDDIDSNKYPKKYDDMESLINGKDMGLL